MPICIPDRLPAVDVLRDESVFVMTSTRANQQDIRPLKVLLLNLMPKKIETENQFLRLLSNSPLQVDIQLLRVDNREPKNTPSEHLNNFYCNFNDIREQNFDGLIITGANLELVELSDIAYWQQLTEIIHWSQTHVTSTLFVCWSVYAALNILYSTPKLILNNKLSGVYWHEIIDPHALLTRGFDDQFLAPHSRYIDFPLDMIKKYTDLNVFAQSEQVGAYLMATNDKRMVFATGHPEYDPYTLSGEYFRDVAAGLNPTVPLNYFPNDNPELPPKAKWRSHGHLLFSNWLNYFVYQITPYDLGNMSPTKE